MEGTFAITTHVAIDRIVDWLLAHGYESHIDAHVDLIAHLADHEPITFVHDGQRYSVNFVSAIDAFDVSIAA